MKQKILLFTGTVLFLFLTLSGYKNGPGAAQQMDFSGRVAGETCFKAGCHAGGAGTTICSLEIRRKDWGPNSPAVRGYIAGQQYLVTICGQNSSLPKFGFQVTAVADGANAGTFSALPTGVHQSNTSGGIKVVEHSAPLEKKNDTFKVSFEWTAPTTTSTVSFHGIINAVNEDGTNGGDKPSGAIKVDLTDFTSISGVADKPASIKAYPNPVAGNTLNIGMENTPSGNYSLNIYDIRGREIYANDIGVRGSVNTTAVDCEKWSTGVYLIHLSSPDMNKVLTVIRQ